MEMNPGNDMIPSLLAVNTFVVRFDESIMNSVPNILSIICCTIITIIDTAQRLILLPRKAHKIEDRIYFLERKKIVKSNQMKTHFRLILP